MDLAGINVRANVEKIVFDLHARVDVCAQVLPFWKGNFRGQNNGEKHRRKKWESE